MALIFINRFFYPDHSATSQLLTDLTRSLSASGDVITVVTSRQRYDDASIKLAARDRYQGVEIVRLWTTRFGRFNLAGRAVDYLSFYLSAALHLLLHVRKHDFVIAKTDPPMLSVVVGPIARIKRAKLVNWLQDLFPEVAVVVGPRRGAMRPLYGLMKIARDHSLRIAHMNVVLGDRMAERVAALGVQPDRIRVISNWADADVLSPVGHQQNSLRAEWGLQGHFVIGYSGNLGRAHEYETLLDAIAEVEQRPSNGPTLRWLFVGGGALYEKFKRESFDRGLRSIVFKAYQPRERLAESLSAADVHLVSLRPELEGLIVPSKLYGIMAVGRPIIFIGDLDGEIARIVRRYDCGVTVAPGDGRGLASIASSLASDASRRERLGKNARAAFEQTFDKSKGVEQWRRLLTSI